jgi:membrane-associated phospholipid phosphatase
MQSVIFYGLLGYLAMQQIRTWRARVGTIVVEVVLVILIGFSRLYLGVHYLSDVLAGYAAGVVWLACTITGVETVRRYRWDHAHTDTAPERTRSSVPPTLE